MSSPVSVEALGLRVDVHFDGAHADELEGATSRAWTRCRVAGGHDQAGVTLRAGIRLEPGPGVVTGDEPDVVLERLTQRITVEAVNAQAGRLLMLHACAVAHPRTGATAVLVGPSGMGKTTLAASLGRRWGYLSDETAAMRPDGSVWPYPKPLSVVTPGHAKQQRSPDDLGLQVAAGPSQPRLLLLLDRRPGVTQVGLERLSTVEAVCLLAEHTSHLSRLPTPLHRIADLVDRCDGLHRVVYGEGDHLAPVVADAIGDAS